jgi:hypothetical protein
MTSMKKQRTNDHDDNVDSSSSTDDFSSEGGEEVSSKEEMTSSDPVVMTGTPLTWRKKDYIENNDGDTSDDSKDCDGSDDEEVQFSDDAFD